MTMIVKKVVAVMTTTKARMLTTMVRMTMKRMAMMIAVMLVMLMMLMMVITMTMMIMKMLIMLITTKRIRQTIIFSQIYQEVMFYQIKAGIVLL